MRGSLLPLLLCSGCIAPGPPSARLGVELRSLAAAVAALEACLDDQTARPVLPSTPPPTAPSPAAAPPRTAAPAAPAGETGSAPPPAAPDLRSRLAPPPAGALEVQAAERPFLQQLARDLAAFPPARAGAIVIEYCQTTEGLARSAKLLGLMDQRSRAAILETLRPAEVRALIELSVDVRPAPAAPPSITQPETAASEPAAPRFVPAGSGTGGWRTVLDTATGVVYNFRGGAWVPITLPLRPEAGR